MVERFGLFENIGGIGLRLEKDGEWVRHSDHLAIIGRIEDDRTDEHVQWMAELSALKKQVEELTAERDDARQYAVEARLRENQAEDRRISESFARTKAEAEAAALRKALEFYADVSKYPAPLTGGMGDLWADCGRIARSALASTRETSDAG
jgi:multidrug efflux pump subunit AcrA (membrane-fusion protein)